MAESYKYIPAVEDAIKIYIKTKGISMQEMGEQLGVSPQAISFILKRGFTGKTALKWERTFGFNREFLQTGQGQLMKEVEERPSYSDNSVPLIPVFAQAGHLVDFADSVTEYECERIISPVAGAEVAIPVYGESMYPEFPDGSIVFVKRINERSFIEWGKTYVVDTVNGSIIKYLAPSDKDGYIRCISANPDPRYAPFDVPCEDIKAIFKVVMCMAMK